MSCAEDNHQWFADRERARGLMVDLAGAVFALVVCEPLEAVVCEDPIAEINNGSDDGQCGP